MNYSDLFKLKYLKEWPGEAFKRYYYDIQKGSIHFENFEEKFISCLVYLLQTGRIYKIYKIYKIAQLLATLNSCPHKVLGRNAKYAL